MHYILRGRAVDLGPVERRFPRVQRVITWLGRSEKATALYREPPRHRHDEMSRCKMPVVDVASAAPAAQILAFITWHSQMRTVEAALSEKRGRYATNYVTVDRRRDVADVIPASNARRPLHNTL